jgi:hypothetical protein
VLIECRYPIPADAYPTKACCSQDKPLDIVFRPQPMEAAMERFVHNAKIDLYRRLIAESERNPKRDEDRHKMLLTLCQ